MGLDRIEQLVIRQGGILETQFGEGRALLPQQVAQRAPVCSASQATMARDGGVLRYSTT